MQDEQIGFEGVRRLREVMQAAPVYPGGVHRLRDRRHVGMGCRGEYRNVRRVVQDVYPSLRPVVLHGTLLGGALQSDLVAGNPFALRLHFEHHVGKEMLPVHRHHPLVQDLPLLSQHALHPLPFLPDGAHLHLDGEDGMQEVEFVRFQRADVEVGISDRVAEQDGIDRKTGHPVAGIHPAVVDTVRQ